MLKIAYHTLGCKVNQYETEKIRETLEQAGFETVSFNGRADAYVINTCGVTSVADGKSRAAVRRAVRCNPDAYVVVTGCYSEIETQEVTCIEGVDLIVPNEDKESIPARLISRFGRNADMPGDSSITMPSRPRTRTRAVVKVQDGCDQFCGYCVIPFARPGKRSRPVDEVINELRTLAEFGYKEVVLAGIRLGSYDGVEDGVPGLIRAASDVDGIERIRLSSIEPWEVDDRLLDAMRNPKVCRHLHIPLQSGDDRTLRLMNRPYTAATYSRIIGNVRRQVPGIGITTDVIVGFPGEDDEAFGNTRSLIEEAEFSRLHVFRYSARPRTKAASMSHQVEPSVKKARADELIELGRRAMCAFAESNINEILDILVERAIPADESAGMYNNISESSKLLTGFTDNYLEVAFQGEPELKGRIVPVRITQTDRNGKAYGVVCNDERMVRH